MARSSTSSSVSTLVDRSSSPPPPPSRSSTATSTSTSSGSKKNKRVETVLNVSGVALAAFKEGTPCFNQIIGLALFIVQTTQSVRSNKEAYELLVKDVDQLSGRVLQAFEGSPEFAVQEIPAKFQPFIDALVDIKAFAVKRMERNIFARVVKSTADLDEIRIFKERLRQALDVLGLESQITIHHMDKNIKSISKQQDELLDIVKWLKIREEKEEALEKQRIIDCCDVGGEGGKALVDATSTVVPKSSAVGAAAAAAAPVLELGRVDEDEEVETHQVASPVDTSPVTSRSNTLVDTLPTGSTSPNSVEPPPKVHVEEAPVGSAHVDSSARVDPVGSRAVTPSLSPVPETKEATSPQRNPFLPNFSSSAPPPAISRSSPPPASTSPPSTVSRPAPSPSPQPQPTVAAAHSHSRSWSTPPPQPQSQGTYTSSPYQPAGSPYPTYPSSQTHYQSPLPPPPPQQQYAQHPQYQQYPQYPQYPRPHHAYTYPPPAASPYQSYNQYAYGAGAGSPWGSSASPAPAPALLPPTSSSSSAAMGSELELRSPGVVADEQGVPPQHLQTHPIPPPPSSWSYAPPPMSTPPPPPPPPSSGATQVVAPAFDFRGATINGEIKYTVVQGSQTVHNVSRSVIYANGSEERSGGGDYGDRRNTNRGDRERVRNRARGRSEFD